MFPEGEQTSASSVPPESRGESSYLGWETLLPGSSGEAARDSIRSIADALAPYAGGDIPVESAEPIAPAAAAARRATLGHGAPGMALFFTYLDRAQPASGHDDTARRFLDQAVEALSTVPLPPTLYGGLTGVTWTLAHLGSALYDPDDDDPLDEIDDMMLTYLGRQPWSGHYDLISGLVGHAVYAFERLPRPAAAASLEAILDRLGETSEETPDGITWKTHARLLPLHQRAAAPEGHYNLGVAHGVPGVITVLAGMQHHGIGGERTRTLLQGSLEWLWAQPRPAGGHSRFGYFFASDLPVKPCRMAWCYGDPGIAATGILASDLADLQTIRSQWHALGREAARCPVDKAGVVDTPLCHGSAGLGHVYNRLHLATGDPALAEAARFWFQDTLDRRRDDRSIAGYASWESEQWIADPGYLTGAAGIGLALLAATSDVEPGWDRPLLLSLPRRDASASDASEGE